MRTQDEVEQPRAVPLTAKDTAARLEAAFRTGASEAIRRAHEANISMPVIGEDGRVAWLHPDGIVRPVRDIPPEGGA